jgi:hypothetical protein
VLLLSHQQSDQSRHDCEIYRRWVIEYCVLVENRIDCSAATHGVIFAKYVAQITKQQGRYAWTSCSPFQIVGREPPDLN